MANLRREGTPARVFYFEHGINGNIQAALAERYSLWTGIPACGDGAIRRSLALHRFLGHELFRIFPPGGRVVVPKLDNAWTEGVRGVVSTWQELETFAWPDPRAVDLTCMEQVEALAPANMRAFHVMDIWEAARGLMGFETLCIALYEDPKLVKAIFARVGEFVLSMARMLCDFEFYGAVYIGDDLGHKTGTMISPDHIREFVLPWHRRVAKLAHEKGKLFLFHSCGDMYALIDDYIKTVGIDAKHSFENNVLPVDQAKARYGDRLSLLGGMDVDFLARATPLAVRERTRGILAACQPGGGYCLGSGNWVTDYIPAENYLAMLAEARQFGSTR